MVDVEAIPWPFVMPDTRHACHPGCRRTSSGRGSQRRRAASAGCWRRARTRRPAPSMARAPSAVRWSEPTQLGSRRAIQMSTRFSRPARRLAWMRVSRVFPVVVPIPLNAKMRDLEAHMILETSAAPPFMKNGFVIGCEERREGIVIDPGDDVEELLEAVVASRPRRSIHPADARAPRSHHRRRPRRRKRSARRSVLHRDDNFLYEAVVQQGEMFGFRVDAQPPVDQFYDGEGPWMFGTVRRVGVPHARPLPGWGVPGGRPSGVERADVVRRRHALCRSIGRTDLPGGDLADAAAVDREVLFSFPDDTPVYSGHGERRRLEGKRAPTCT